VPERREERTTEGGLDAAGQHNHLAPFIQRLSESGIRASLFIEPAIRQIEAARALAAPVVELHVGAYCEATLAGETERAEALLKRIHRAADAAAAFGLEVHAGHGITYETVGPIARHPWIQELNIGHFIIGEAIFTGLDTAIRGMRHRMEEARREGLAES
jgi:pyridoxine 5-phosphate synthase